MKKLVAFAAVIAVVSFTSCGNKSVENAEAAKAETKAMVEEVAAPADKVVATPCDSASVAPCDSAKVEAPAVETEAAPAE